MHGATIKIVVFSSLDYMSSNFTFSEPCIVQHICVSKTTKMHTLFPLLVTAILSSTCFEQTSLSSGGNFCKRSV